MTSIVKRVRGIATRFQRPAECSACHLPQGTDRRLISGPAVSICETCIRDAAAGQRSTAPTTRCSFCGHDTRLAGVWPDVAICPDCLALAQRILDMDDRSRPTT